MTPSQEEPEDQRPIDAELMRLVAQRRAAIAGDPEWDRVLSRFVMWAVEDDDDEVSDPTIPLRAVSISQG